MESYNYMKNNHLYDMCICDTKIEAGFTTNLYSYKSPFIFNSGAGNYSDIETFIHEFGHYNNIFHTSTHYLTDSFNVDVSEIHSQALELLMLQYAQDIYGESFAEYIRAEVLNSILSSIIDGCLYDEFQHEVYSSDHEMTLFELNTLFGNLSEEYGYEVNENGENYTWVLVDHTFKYPMYYIGYATSALSALDIWSISETDMDSAIDIYMQTSAKSSDTGYCQLVRELGLRNIFEEDTIKSISESLSNNDGQSDFYDSLPGVLVILVTIIYVAIIIFVTIALRKRYLKKKNVNEEESPYVYLGDSPLVPTKRLYLPRSRSLI